MRNRILALAALTALTGAFVFQASPAQAAQELAGLGKCQASFVWPTTSGTTTCDGNFVGTIVDDQVPAPVVCGAQTDLALDCTLTANITHYEELCVPNIPQAPPLAGLANGTITIKRGAAATTLASYRFSWVRVGATVLIVPVKDSGQMAGVAAFVPDSQILNASCAVPKSFTATVVGITFGQNAI